MSSLPLLKIYTKVLMIVYYPSSSRISDRFISTIDTTGITNDSDKDSKGSNTKNTTHIGFFFQCLVG